MALIASATLLGPLLAGACGGSAPGSVGSNCDPDVETPCGDGLSCTENADGDNLCTYDAGQPCMVGDESVDNAGCGPDASCTPQSMATTGAGGSSAEDAGLCLLNEGALCNAQEDFCGEDLVCAETTAGDFRCFGRVVFRGEVTDTSNAAAIAKAHVIALDEEGAAVTDIAVTDTEGSYALDIPVVRDESGAPVDSTFTLQGSAQDYLPFPKGVRVALPINAANATQEGTIYVLDSALTDLGLIPLEEGTRFSISGQLSGLEDESNLAGLLVVATGAGGSFTATTDLNGNFTIFNVVDGDYQVTAYAAGIQVGTEQVSVAGSPVADVMLPELDEPTTTVSGNIQIVNAPGGSLTSVILVVADTFDPDAARGEVPRGLRAPATGPVSIDGDFSIEGVPAGDYVVLAAYENDDLVRDPDTNIAGTSFVNISVSAGEETLAIPESFKVTEALATVSPGAAEPEAVTEKPLLEWADDSSEDWYVVKVFDAFGNLVWEPDDVPGVSGSPTVSLQYEGPLEPGMYYQFRVTSWRQPGKGDAAPISTTEDLRGVFFLSPQ